MKRGKKNQVREGWSDLKKGRERWPIKWKRKNLEKKCQKRAERAFGHFFEVFPFPLYWPPLRPFFRFGRPSLTWFFFPLFILHMMLLCDIVRWWMDIAMWYCYIVMWYVHMILYSSLNQCDVVTGWSFLYNIVIIFVSFWDHCGFLFGPSCDCFGIILNLFWDNFGMGVGYLWPRVGVMFR